MEIEHITLSGSSWFRVRDGDWQRSDLTYLYLLQMCVRSLTCFLHWDLYTVVYLPGIFMFLLPLPQFSLQLQDAPVGTLEVVSCYHFSSKTAYTSELISISYQEGFFLVFLSLRLILWSDKARNLLCSSADSNYFNPNTSISRFTKILRNTWINKINM